jgi:hypothetical protein
MSLRHLARVAAKREPQHLVAQANPEHGMSASISPRIIEMA